jgi:hypothetical protein
MRGTKKIGAARTESKLSVPGMGIIGLPARFTLSKPYYITLVSLSVPLKANEVKSYTNIRVNFGGNFKRAI